jgi:hypothetical protein
MGALVLLSPHDILAVVALVLWGMICVTSHATHQYIRTLARVSLKCRSESHWAAPKTKKKKKKKALFFLVSSNEGIDLVKFNHHPGGGTLISSDDI